jgi:hypothetical protein
MSSRPQPCRCLALVRCVALAGCASLDKYSYETFRPDQTDPGAGVARSDALALIYADYVAKLLEGRSTGARLTRELSDSSLAIASTLTAAHETLKISAETLAIMGTGVLIVRDLQGIFNARGRSEAFADAAYLIRQAQAEYRGFNPEPSADYMTENGATLVRRVDSALYAARKTLIGRMPTLVDLQQAHQAMTESGASRKPPGTPTSLVTATGEPPLPQATIPPRNEPRQFTSEEAETIKGIAKEQKASKAFRAEINKDYLSLPVAVKAAPGFYVEAINSMKLEKEVPVTTATEDDYLKAFDETTDKKRLEGLKAFIDTKKKKK